MKKILVINGVNLNLLGLREPGVYGVATLKDIEELVAARAKQLGASVDFFQSNIEGEVVNAIHGTMGRYDGIIMNPGAWTHYAYALHDALTSVKVPCIEVHISNIHKREEFRHHSVTAPACAGQIAGLGISGYVYALEALCNEN